MPILPPFGPVTTFVSQKCKGDEAHLLKSAHYQGKAINDGLSIGRFDGLSLLDRVSCSGLPVEKAVALVYTVKSVMIHGYLNSRHLICGNRHKIWRLIHSN